MTLKKGLLLGGLAVGGIFLLYLLYWMVAPTQITSKLRDGGRVEPDLATLELSANHPLTKSAISAIKTTPVTSLQHTTHWTWRGPQTKLVISFPLALTGDVTYTLSVPRRSLFRSDGTFQLSFHTNPVTFTSKRETGSEHSGEISGNPIINRLPHDEARWSVEWQETNQQTNRYILDVIIYYAPGEKPDQALATYKPQALSWIQSTGQPADTYELRYATKPLAEHP